jgi:MYXO-CTERM domain-containing protein
MFGHEYGHHWLNGVEFDQNDGRGRQHFIRGFSNESGEGGQMGFPNQHYSHLADSRSVMYGECITDLGNGSFRFEGCERKYSHFDQYLMGVRGACEVSPMMVLEDQANPGRGEDVIAMGRTTSSRTRSGLTRHDITIEEIQRAMGVRSPAYPHAPRCWRVAFVVVLAPGQTAVPPAMLAKVERYRQRWSQWFTNATDGRGTMRTNVIGPGCPVQVPIADPCNPDAGVRWPDGGVYVPDDAGVIEEPDAGTEPDAGVTPDPDAGPSAEPDAGVDAPDAGPTQNPQEPGLDQCLNCDLTKIRPGCGCGASDGALWAAVVFFAGLSRRRRSR